MSEVKARVGIFSEYGVAETRERFWDSFAGGQSFAKRQSMWDLFFVGLSGASRDENTISILLRWLLNLLINFTIGLVAALIHFAFRLWLLVASYQPDFVRRDTILRVTSVLRLRRAPSSASPSSLLPRWWLHTCSHSTSASPRASQLSRLRPWRRPGSKARQAASSTTSMFHRPARPLPTLHCPARRPTTSLPASLPLMQTATSFCPTPGECHLSAFVVFLPTGSRRQAVDPPQNLPNGRAARFEPRRCSSDLVLPHLPD